MSSIMPRPFSCDSVCRVTEALFAMLSFFTVRPDFGPLGADVVAPIRIPCSEMRWRVVVAAVGLVLPLTLFHSLECHGDSLFPNGFLQVDSTRDRSRPCLFTSPPASHAFECHCGGFIPTCFHGNASRPCWSSLRLPSSPPLFRAQE